MFLKDSAISQGDAETQQSLRTPGINGLWDLFPLWLQGSPVNDSVLSPHDGAVCCQRAEVSSACKPSFSARWEFSQLAMVEESGKHVWLFFISCAVYTMHRRTGALRQAQLGCWGLVLGPRAVLATHCFPAPCLGSNCLCPSPTPSGMTEVNHRVGCVCPSYFVFLGQPPGWPDQYLDSQSWNKEPRGRPGAGSRAELQCCPGLAGPSGYLLSSMWHMAI